MQNKTPKAGRRNLLSLLSVCTGSSLIKAWSPPIVIGVLLPTHAHASGVFKLRVTFIDCFTTGSAGGGEGFTNVIVHIESDEDEDLVLDIVQIRTTDGNVYAGRHGIPIKGKSGARTSVYSELSGTFQTKCWDFVRGAKTEILARKSGGVASWHYFVNISTL